MKQTWSLHFLDFAESLHKGCHIVAVKGAEVAYVESFENILLFGNQGFQRVVEAYHPPFPLIIDHPPRFEKFVKVEAHLVVAFGGGEP